MTLKTLKRLESRFDFKDPPVSPEEVEKFHKERRMFCIKDGSIILAPQGFNGSHAKWFLEEEWISEEDDRLMQEIVRGMVHQGNLYFYSGWNFRVDEEVEGEFFVHAEDLMGKLAQEGLEVQNVYGGLVDVQGRVNFKPIKCYPDKCTPEGVFEIDYNEIG